MPAEALRVLHLITGLETGGAERMLTRVVIGSDRERFASRVVSMTTLGAMAEPLRSAGFPAAALGMRRGRADPRGLFRLVRLLRHWRPHLLQSWLYHADLLGLAAHLLGCSPHLLWNIRCSELVGSPLLYRLLGPGSQLPDGVIVNSLAGQRFHQQLGYRPKRWEYIPNGFDSDEFRPCDDARRRIRGQLGIAESAIAIGMAARYHPMKDHATFLSAAARLTRQRGDVVFLLAGSGIAADNRELAAAIEQRGLTRHVRLLGERPDIAAVYPGFDIAALSSAFGEGCPNALGEAMACGVPCVATDCGDSAALIGDTGLVVAPSDPVALAAAWERMAEMPPDERRALGLRARRRLISGYSVGAMIRRYERLYVDIAGAGLKVP